jgi:1-acyl-sn-glycerol-3-phosphate acyltransferase
MSAFVDNYEPYVQVAEKLHDPFGFDLKAIERIEPVLSFLFHKWWRVDITGLQYLPKDGPALLVGNSGSVLPWPALMLLYAMMADKEKPRQLSILVDMDWVQDERLYQALTAIGFVPWSSDNAKRLFEANQVVLTFPEGIAGCTKPFQERYRLRDFDWTKLMPAVENGIPIFPLSTLGCDESVPVLANIESVAKLLKVPEFPITPFFPLLPFPISFLSLPVAWHMRILKLRQFNVSGNREDIIETTKRQARFSQGEIQAELNRLLRQRIKPLF